MRVEIGSICEKGQAHAGFITDDDYWPCGSHTMGKVFVEFDSETSPEEAGNALYVLFSDMAGVSNFRYKSAARDYITESIKLGNLSDDR